MRRNRLRELLLEGKPTLGTHVIIPWPGVVEIIGHSGAFDYVEYVGEYSPFSLEMLDDFGRAGWEPFRPALACLDALLGRTVELVTGSDRHRGRAVGLDDEGRLLLEIEEGTIKPFRGGDVHLVPGLRESEEG